MSDKIFFYVLGLILGMTLLVAAQMPDGKTRIIACEVGQGDAILITKNENQILIDGGPSGEKVLACLTKHMPFWDRTIELIVLTNTDSDHLNGLLSVVERYILGDFVTADGIQESGVLERLVDILAKRRVTVVPVEQGDTIMVGERDKLELKVLWPAQVEERNIAVLSSQIDKAEREQILGASAKKGSVNERSVVLLLREGDYRALFTGDAGFQAEKSMLESGMLVDVDYLKVGHHGSKFSTSLEFLQKIRPEQAVISVGRQNRYGHPTQEVLERLSKVGAQVRRTDQDGEVITVVN